MEKIVKMINGTIHTSGARCAVNIVIWRRRATRMIKKFLH